MQPADELDRYTARVTADLAMLNEFKTLVESHGELPRGRGMVTGVIALTLSVLCILGVAAFHFPQYLTTPELRRSYDVAMLRHLLFASMVIAGGLALVNIVLNRSRWLSSAAFALVLLAALLGRHKVEVDPNFPDHTPHVGLDWFILDLLGSALLFIFVEKLFALRKDQPVFRAGWQTDFQHFVVNHMLIGFMLLATNLVVHRFFGWAAHDGVRGWVAALPFWAGVLLIVLVADLVQYWTHRAYHEVPWLWRLHAVHHSAKHMDWMAGSPPARAGNPDHPQPGAGAHLPAGLFQRGDRCLHRHRRFPGRVQPRERERAARATAPRDRHAELPPLAPQPGRRGAGPQLRGPLRVHRPPVRHRGQERQGMARALRRARRLRARGLRAAVEVSVHLEGLTRGTQRPGRHARPARCVKNSRAETPGNKLHRSFACGG
jgi:hypothetical protein